ncbi:MAG: protein kinase domain-containing protein [Gammaproteobacteria bacterium]
MTLTPFITLNAEQSNSLLSNNVIQCYTTKKTPFFDVYRIAIRDDAGELVDEQYYLVNTSDSTSFLGQGAFGKVLKAYLLKVDRTNADSQGQTFAVDILHPVVLKCCFEKEDKERQELDLLQEISILHQIDPDVSRGITTVTYANGEIAFVFAQRYIAGKPVKHTALQNQIAKLSITERSLIQLQGMMQIHNFHCQTNQPVLFADIKLENTLLAISVVNGQIQIIFSLIDVGVSLTLTSQNITDIINAMGSIATMAPEVANRQASPKSDIYSYVSIMLYWLGVDEPRVEKAKDRRKLDADGQIILSNYIMKDYLHPGKIILPSINVQTRLQIQVLITKFIMRMMATKVELRADTHESLSFTNTFYHLCLLNDRMQAINHYKENNSRISNVTLTMEVH